MQAMAEAVIPDTREFRFDDQDFAFLRDMVREQTGINLSEAKRELVYSRLSRRLRQLGLSGFSEYCALLQQGDAEELVRMVNALTTNLTAFFREQHHFDYLRQHLLPELVRHDDGRRRLRVWSAGCSTGQEPYSIAMVLAETLTDIENWDARILATDLDTDVLEFGRLGIYTQDKVDKIERARLQRWFLRGRDRNAGKVRVVSELRRLITFRQLNLIRKWPMRGPFDMIFCRNTLIYFDKETQRDLVARFSELLTPEGCLFLGHSESLHNVSEAFRLVGNTIYRRLS